ncbi:isoleucine--tRNA ligase [Ilyobacter polytropus]|uniref:Isoleucine--tRNA ligase n=1 Tax=Ilyobacter polytropus (strain ATCC 51220 / DSM 2926 / LMG 16218 / CuHBu1) TaxID=572544 RepID=E3H6S9_ILYPC|nr:isoleucine--tRNA ligase [Ilyobacter polytropus]ADO82448.1 Isoleucyl-tRNA synthetase [Ilyobacter polytropus DSM 2926]
MSDERDYGKTLNLPKTSFQMRANLPNKEPLILKQWDKDKIYKKSLEGKEKQFILHDGPPYANGNIHIGHALNKILKDIILKYKRLQGYNAPYIPGWDTHGLPIELKVTEELGEAAKDMSPLKIRDKCTKYAKKWVQKQKSDFIRLGVMGDWDNPYLTLNPEYEAKQLEVFKELYENGYIFKGLKPIYWSPATETALAEAEIEYKNHVSPSIYVKMEANSDLLEKLGLDEASLVIWTTTPWTIPANVAICLNAEFEYGVYKTEKGNLILAKGLSEKAFADMGIENVELLKEFTGDKLERTTYKHPFLDRTGVVILGEHVTMEAGTGCVHTAPGHGQDDYVVGTRYGLPVISPINNKGHLTEEAGKFAGMFYKKANKEIAAHMDETGHLLMLKEIEHSYPHDWRSKTPVIFRATEQWFVRAEGSDLREKALKAIEDVDFIPAWGRNRISTMLESRPDWCISRQRIWGVPIPIFYNEATGEEIFYGEIIDRVIGIVKKEGTIAWVKYSPEELIGEELLEKYNLAGLELRKETNIMDVWFDSGVSHRSVLETRENLKRPADLYLEGSDQHRGWFQTSLLTSIGSTGDAPYKQVLTHGFVNDGEGKKMSKSTGNVMSPDDVIKTYGADILRLWCASVDYREDVKISENILKQMAEAYRRVRNTARYILGNTNDFDPIKDRVSYDELPEIDRWAMHKLETLKRKVTENYNKYEFYNLFHDIHYFAGIDMSAFYLDIIKDRLYAENGDSVDRRAAQTVMYEVLVSMNKMIAPILSFTAEEIWSKIPETSKDAESILISKWYENNDQYIDEELAAKWDQIIKIRKDANKSLEKARQGENRIIGNSLDAKVLIKLNDEGLAKLLEENRELIEGVLIVSSLEIVSETDETFTEGEEVEGMFVKVLHAEGEKCERCWKYSTEIGTLEEHPTICPRCSEVLSK